MTAVEFPDGKRFAFTVMDDTDVATLENVQPVYCLLEQLGMRVTKTVWSVGCPEGSENFSSSQTLEDVEYREFLIGLQNRGFEIGHHCATMESSTRERTIAALERFRSTFGAHPRVHANHAYNRENLYWGAGRIDDPFLKFLYSRLNGTRADYYLGHVEGSAYWWGDLCASHVPYVRNLTFNEINLARINPSMPYHDPARPLVSWWFSAVDADDVEEFNALLCPDKQEQLERENGICIVATHFGKGFATDGCVHAVTRQRLEALASRRGWFPTVGELLDWLRPRRGTGSLPQREWRYMQWRWAMDYALRDKERRWSRARRVAS
ncbi:MAG: hypothetical protein ACREX4_14390 [Gammaproteobacteria bacterium]